MTQQLRVREFSRTALALAVLAAFASAQAQDKKEEEKKSPIETEITLEGGAAYVSGDPADRAFWGQYNGLRNQDVYGIANFNYSRRDTSTGTWLDVYGSNLGLQTREIGVFWTRQGEWKLNANYDELWRVNPYTVNTGVQGAGGTTPTSNYLFGGAGSGGDYQPNTKRQKIELGGSKAFGSAWLVEGSVNSENKNGTQLFGIGNNCTSASGSGCAFSAGSTAGFGVLYYPQPIDYNHTQVDARVNWSGSSLQLSGGYYGSFFSNSNGSMNPGVPSTLNNAVGQGLPATSVVAGVPGMQGYLSQPVALSPDNSFNQFDLTGAYVFSPMIRSNFKLAYSKTTQDQDFAGMGLTGAPAGVSSLNGEVTNTLALFRVVANPIAKLSLLGEYRYANKEDDTAIVPYSQVGAVQYSNQRVSREVNNGRLEATYRFPYAIQGTAGWGFESINRGSYTTSASYAGVSAMREETDETTWFLQLRRNMTETISGMLGYSVSSRDGSNWLAPGTNGVGLVPVSDPAAQLGANAIYMPTLADRDRSKLRFLLTWTATDALTVQFAVDAGTDDYKAPTQYALQQSKFDLYTLDVNYALSDAWNLNGYFSSGSQKIHQARPGGYILAFDDKSLNAGIGFNGKATEKLRLGGTLGFVSNTDTYAQSLDSTAAPGSAQLLAVTGGLPDVVYRRTELRFYGAYDLSKRSALRLDAAYQRLTYEDWGFAYGGTPFLYSDNTTVHLQPDQNVGYLGVSYIYSWK
jgi:MtrB/PioB family decaheme-associated outer membrane protein